jgi:two-component system, LytTR family, sensor kinase
MNAINLKSVPNSSYAGNTKMKRNTVYWISQFSGWFLYFLINLVVFFIIDKLNWERTALLFSFCTFGFFLTHLYRNYAKKHNWISLQLKKMIPLVLIASTVIGLLMYTPYHVINQLFNIYEVEGNPAGRFIIGTLSTIIVIFSWSLLYFAIHFFENYKRAEIESYIWEAAVKDFELKTLKSQLNPHFMFNAMNSIRALIVEDPEGAKTALTKLSNILRYSLKIERTETVPLEEEIQTVKDYLTLEGIRFEERLKYNLNIDPKSSKIEIPPMMIQTLVENSIKHGISKRTKGGTVSIETMMNGSRLFIRIKNSGHLDSEAVRMSQGFGISNTKHRLSLIYGEKSSFDLRNADEDQVCAEIVIPTGGNFK